MRNLQPQRQVEFSSIDVATIEPIKALMMNGAEVSEETRPRHLSVVMSAMMICVSSCSPLQNG